MGFSSSSTASTGRVSPAERPFTGVQIFSATMAKERDLLGERITNWLRTHPEIEVVDSVVTQSSDDAFHCLAITLFYRDRD